MANASTGHLDAPLVLNQLWQHPSQFETLPWQPFRPGVEIYPLYGEPTRDTASALLRYQPGASVPAHTHLNYEHILVLWGSQEDEHGHYDAGTLLVNPPGSSHRVCSAAGCVVLAIWSGGLTVL